MKVKYGILAYPNIAFFPKDGFSFQFGQGARLVVERMSVTVKDKHWADWLGSLKWDQLCQAEIQVQIWQESKNPEVVDAENQEIQNQLGLFANALTLSDLLVPPSAKPFILTGTGALESGKLVPLDIRTFGSGPTWLQPGYVRLNEYRESPDWIRVTKSEAHQYSADFFDKWRLLYEELRKVSDGSPEHFLIKLSLYSFQQALADQLLDFSVPNLGRTIETLVALSVGQGRSFFARRARRFLPDLGTLTFTLTEERVTDILGESYGLRSDAVHGKPFGYGLGRRRDAFLKDEVQHYVYVLEILARSTIKAFLNDATLLGATKDRKTLEEYWNKIDPPPDQSLCPTCNQPIRG